MTTVNVSQLSNTVVVGEDNNCNTVVNVITPGPQGPAGTEIDDSARVDKSVIYYDASTSTYRADATWTTNTLTDGGNF